MNDEFNMNLKEISKEDSYKAASSEAGKIHFRCPSCSKLFSANAVNIQAEKPEFTCNGCKTDFWISFSQALSMNEVVGYKITDSMSNEANALPPEIKIFEEDFRGKDFVKEHSSKETFGLLEQEPEKNEKKDSSILDDLKSLIDEVSDSDLEFIENGKEPFREEPSLGDFWSNVLGDYSDMSLHDEFVNYCKELDDVGYAAGKYQSMLDVNKHDQIAKKYLNKINHTAVMTVENEALATKDEMERISRLGAWSSGLIGVGALFVVVGFTFIQLKNLVGLGIALIFFTIAMQALLSKN